MKISELEKFKTDSTTAQLRLCLPNQAEYQRVECINLIKIFCEDYMILDLEVNGGKLNFNRFIDAFSEKRGLHMSKNNSPKFESNQNDINNFPLAVRFAARKAILNAQIKSKVAAGKLGLPIFTCDLWRNSRLSSRFNISPD